VTQKRADWVLGEKDSTYALQKGEILLLRLFYFHSPLFSASRHPPPSVGDPTGNLAARRIDGKRAQNRTFFCVMQKTTHV
jgi:hypothetical protein